MWHIYGFTAITITRTAGNSNKWGRKIQKVQLGKEQGKKRFKAIDKERSEKANMIVGQIYIIKENPLFCPRTLKARHHQPKALICEN